MSKSNIRKIYSTAHIDVHYDKDWKEYLVTPQGIKIGECSSYFAEDKQDAIDTAQHMEYCKQYPRTNAA